jgi:hypothetical protein
MPPPPVAVPDSRPHGSGGDRDSGRVSADRDRGVDVAGREVDHDDGVALAPELGGGLADDRDGGGG